MHFKELRDRAVRPNQQRIGGFFLAGLICLLQAACGGGSGDAPAAQLSAAPGTVTPTPATTMSGLSNVQDLSVEAGPANGVNLLYTSVTVCAPGDSASCKVIDHVLVDTGSTGLRVFSSLLPSSLKLLQQPAGNGAALVECTQFADGFSWGPIKVVDLKLGGEMVHGLPIQVIADPNFATVPSDCSSSGPSENTVRAFGSNGVLGIGNFLNDCGDGCAQRAIGGMYYACTAGSCVSTVVPVSQQVKHPVSLLTQDNNGVLIRLPAVPSPGASALAGTLIFGIGTQTNNGLGAARVYGLNPRNGTLSVSINGTTYANSFVDSGSNGYFFPFAGVPQCTSGFYCPASPLQIAAVVQGTNGNNAALAFTIDNADKLLNDNSGFRVLPTLGGSAFGAQTVDLGLPFFFGRSVYTAIEGMSTPGGPGPFVAF
ncbi:MAG: DUF3443 domain-containing protein [Burkholderiaceae bacterium]